MTFRVDEQTFSPTPWKLHTPHDAEMVVQSVLGGYPARLHTEEGLETALEQILADSGHVFIAIDHILLSKYPFLSIILEKYPHVKLQADEHLKSLHGLEQVWTAFHGAELTRHSLCLAIGGGTILDAVGLACALYKRGLPMVSVPTTLVAQADSCIGGKTAINWGGNKNQLGSITPPQAVHIWPEWLGTLPDDHRRAGLCEILRSALVGGEAELARFDQHHQAALAGDIHALGQLIAMALSVKAALVDADEQDRGPRFALNLGHTLGHALEAASDYEIPHGLAVGLGLFAEARFFEAQGYATEVTADDLAKRLGVIIPKTQWACARNLPPAAMISALADDKKRQGATLTWVRCLKPGYCQTTSILQADTTDWLTRNPMFSIDY